jgi:hypothetical protein
VGLESAQDADRRPQTVAVGGGRSLVWVAIILATALYLVAVLLEFLAGGSDSTTAAGERGTSISDYLVSASTYAFVAVGALIALRRPRNSIGWLCLASGLSWGMLLALEAYIQYADGARGGAFPTFEIALVLENVVWIPTIGLMIFLVLVFPDGRLPSPRWRVVAGLTALTLLSLAIVSLFGVRNFANLGHPEVANPLAIAPIASNLELLQFTIVALPVCILAAAVSIGVRYRRERGVERLQLKWLVAAGTAVGVAYAAATGLAGAIAVSGGNPGGPLSVAAYIAEDVAVASFALLPIAIGFATLRHRLYDIDVIVNRTLVYGGATVILAAAFGVAGAGGAHRRALGPHDRRPRSGRRRGVRTDAPSHSSARRPLPAGASGAHPALHRHRRLDACGGRGG